MNRHDEAIRAFALTADRPIAQATFELFWTLLRSIHGPKLLRLKGLVQVAEHPDQPLLVHAVQQILHPPVVLDAWPDAERRSRLVLIVKDIEETMVQRLWAAFLGQMPEPEVFSCRLNGHISTAEGLSSPSLSRAVVPGDRRETRDPCRSLTEQRSGMGPGSSLRCARDDGAGGAWGFVL